MTEAIISNPHINAQVFDDEPVQFSQIYWYRRLNPLVEQEIRLLTLLPAEAKSDILACSLSHVDLDDRPSFEAVSYTWGDGSGDASLSHVVFCDGKRIAITRNCDAVLRSLRRQDTSRILWIDAISIDQTHIIERNRQVKLMATIYSSASQVLAYLGGGSPETLSAITKVMRHLNGTSQEVLTPTYLRDDVKTFLKLPYFDRVWILQEISLARQVTIIAGDQTAQWTAVTVQTLLWLCSSQKIVPPSVLSWLPASQPEDDFLDVLHKSRNCSATDPRDKVFGLLGLVKPSVSQSIAVDYSLEPMEVFTKIAAYILLKQELLDLLKHTSSQRIETDLHPSWVPRWSVKDVYKPLPPQFNPITMRTLASSWFLPSIDNEDAHLYNIGCLEEQAQFYCDICFHLHICDRNVPSSMLPKVAIGEMNESQSSLPCLKIRAHRLDTVVKALLPVNETRYITLPQPVPPAFGSHITCVDCAEHDLYISPCQKSPTVAIMQRDLLIRKGRRVGTGKAFFLTHQSIGISRIWGSHVSLRAGDSIWALVGADVPFLLRGIENHYVLLGECYLHRVTQHHPCACCGRDSTPWPMSTEVVDIW